MKKITEKQRAAVWAIAQGEDTKGQPEEVRPLLKELEGLGLIKLESSYVGPVGKRKRISGWYIAKRGALLFSRNGKGHMIVA